MSVSSDPRYRDVAASACAGVIPRPTQLVPVVQACCGFAPVVKALLQARLVGLFGSSDAGTARLARMRARPRAPSVGWALLPGLLLLYANAGWHLTQADIRTEYRADLSHGMFCDSYDSVVYLPVSCRHTALQRLPTEMPTRTPTRAAPTPVADPTPRPGPANPTQPPVPDPPRDVYPRCTIVDEIDRGADGLVDSITVAQYNENSDLLHYESDAGADGRIDLISDYTYSQDGYLVKHTIDRGADGAIDFVDDYTYDHSGNRVRHETHDGDGSLLYVRTYEYDGASRLIRYTLVRAQYMDLADITDYLYDDDGHRVAQLEDAGGDGVYDSIDRYVWRDEVIVRWEFDSQADGVVDYSGYYEYDNSRRMLLAEYDELDDGVIDQSTLYSYERHGWIVQIDDYSHGRLDSITTYSYDSAGRWTTTEFIGPVYKQVSHRTSFCPK